MRKRLIIAILICVPVMTATGLLLWPRLQFRYIVIHHTATRAGDYESIRAAHRNDRGWSDAAYHLILSNGSLGHRVGTVEASGRYRSLSYALATRSRRHNLRGIHVCIVGDHTHEDPDPRVRAALGHLVRALQRRFWIRDADVLLHCEVSPSECPGRAISRLDVHRWIHDDWQACPPRIRAQHEMVLDRALADPRRMPRPSLRRLLAYGAILVGIALVGSGAIIALRRMVRVMTVWTCQEFQDQDRRIDIVGRSPNHRRNQS